jgi:hypothetical protein
MLVGVSSHDVAWTITTPDGLNTIDEISDRHQMRQTASLLVPFKTTQWTGIRVQAANVPGDLTTVSIAGTGMVTYQVLPVDW